jgi:putative aldouronate transport system substrate-binding protein
MEEGDSMKNRKVLLALVLVLSMILTMLAGCGQGPVSKPDNGQAKNGEQQQTPANQPDDPYAPEEGKKYKISWTNYQIVPAEEGAIVLKMLEEKFNVEIDLWNLEHSRYHELLNLRLASGEIPDVFRMTDPNTLLTYAQQGVLAELPEDFLQKYASDIVKVIDENAPGYMDFGKVNGVQYAIPAINPTNIFRLPLVYRLDWMENVGVTKTPETLEEFEELMYKFAKEDPDRNGKADTYGCSQTVLYPVLGAFGLNISLGNESYFVERDGKLIDSAVAPELKEALAILARWYKDGVLDPEFITGENIGGYWALSHAFINGRIGFSSLGNYYHWLPEGSYMIPTEDGTEIPSSDEANAKEIKLVNPDAKWIQGMPLLGPTGERGIKAYNRLMNFYGIGKLAENEKGKMAKVIEIFNYVSATPDIEERMLYRWGIRGEHWDWINKEMETIKYLPPYDTESGYENRIGAHLGMTLPYPPKAPREQWAYEHGLDKFAIESPIQIGLPKAMQYNAELTKIRDEAIVSIITGDKPIDYFDEYVIIYMAAGGKEVEDEANEYYRTIK